jgi:carboxylesterase
VSTVGTWPIIPGCEAFSHVAGASVGALVSHGFTGTPLSVRGVADALAVAGVDVESPRLPGHGTHIDDMLTTRWADWLSECERAYRLLAARVDRVVLVGQSMGATLVLATALADPDGIAGVVAINPLTRDRGPEALELIDDLLGDGIAVAPGGESDIADPASRDRSYTDTPLAPLRSLLTEGTGPIQGRYGELTMPLRLFTSRQDHVVPPSDSEFLAASWGGSVEHTWLERSYHVATLDYDRDIVAAGTVAFVASFAAQQAPAS